MLHVSQPAISRTGKRRVSERKTTNSMWGGRFAEGPAAVMREINASIPFDKRMWRQDIAGSKAHASMLGAQGILSAADAKTIAEGLDAALAVGATGIQVGTLFAYSEESGFSGDIRSAVVGAAAVQAGKEVRAEKTRRSGDDDAH